MLVWLGAARVFVDMRGQSGAPALLYIHGGPGQGSHEFMAAQGDRLARTLRVVGLDQRGVLRSDPLATSSLSLDDLAADCDLLRRELHIARWTVLAHSIGALIAVRYAAADPQHVTRLILDCPCLDVGDTSSNLLVRAESLLREARREALAADAHAAQSIIDPAQRWTALTEIWQQLGDVHRTLYFHRPEAAQWFDSVWDLGAFTDEQRERGGNHGAALQADPAFFAPVTPMLNQLTQPALLIKGAHDPVCTDIQFRAFQEEVADQRTVVLPDAGHFPQIEQPEGYANLVSRFAGAP